MKNNIKKNPDTLYNRALGGLVHMEREKVA